MITSEVIVKSNTFNKKMFIDSKRPLPVKVVLKGEKVVAIDLKLRTVYSIRN